jgi:hypothetical protein
MNNCSRIIKADGLCGGLIPRAPGMGDNYRVKVPNAP